MVNIVFTTSKNPVTSYSIGDASTPASVAADNPDQIVGTTLDLRQVNIDRATLVLDVSNVSGSVDVSVDALLSYDGTNGQTSSANIFDGVTANSTNTLKLSSVLDTPGYHHYIGLVLDKVGTGTCDVRLYLQAQGA